MLNNLGGPSIPSVLHGISLHYPLPNLVTSSEFCEYSYYILKLLFQCVYSLSTTTVTEGYTTLSRLLWLFGLVKLIFVSIYSLFLWRLITNLLNRLSNFL